MKEWLAIVSDPVVVVINAMALLVIVVGTVQMFFFCLRAMFDHTVAGRELRNGYLIYARWLVAGLTLQLAADIIETASAPTWDDIGRLGAIAVIRTFLNYFLERDMMEAQRLSINKRDVSPAPRE